MSELVRITNAQREMHDELVRCRNKEISLVYPDDMDPRLVVQKAKYAGQLIAQADKGLSMYLVAAGRLHFLARKNKEVLEEAGCSTIKDFEAIIDPDGRHRTSIWNASAAYATFEDELTPAAAAEIGSTNLGVITRALKGKNPSAKDKQRFLTAAKEKTTESLKTWVEQKSGISGPGETSSATYPLFGTLAEITLLKEHLGNQGFHELFELSPDARPIDLILASFDNNANEIRHHDPKQLGAGEQAFQVETAPVGD